MGSVATSVGSVPSPTGGLRAIMLWQLPAAVFDLALLAMVAQLRDRPGPWLLPAAACFLVLVASGLAAVVPWSTVDRRWVMVLPLLDLVAAGLINVYGHDFYAAVLGCALPAGWLAFVFDVPGMLLSATSTTLVAVAPLVIHTARAWPAERVVETTLPPLVIIGICAITFELSRILARSQEALLRSLDDAAVHALTVEGILEAVDAVVCVFRPGQRSTFNAPARAVMRRAGGPALGDPPTHFAPGRVWAEDQTTELRDDEHALARALRGETFSGELNWIGPVGDQVAMVFSAHQLIGPAGDHLGTVLAAWDVTDLLAAISARHSFLTNVSHELRTPLTSIVGNLELLDDELLATGGFDDARERIRVMQRNSEVLLARIEQVLVADGRPQLSVEATDVAALVRTALVKHQVRADGAGLDLVVRTPEEYVGKVDATAYEQVLDNLVTNALKYTSAGSVTVELVTSPEGPRLTVTDTGVGMTRADLRQVFERYFRADRAVRDAIPGIGLGLAITRRLVEAHGGTITLDSTPDVGTTVTVVVPG